MIPGVGHLPSFLTLLRGIWRTYCHFFVMLMTGDWPGGGMSTAGIDWCINICYWKWAFAQGLTLRLLRRFFFLGIASLVNRRRTSHEPLFVLGWDGGWYDGLYSYPSKDQTVGALIIKAGHCIVLCYFLLCQKHAIPQCRSSPRRKSWY